MTLAAAWATSTPSDAQAGEERIAGAFGIEFGARFEPDTAREIRTEPEGHRAYVIDEPPRPYGPLETYTVRVSAKGLAYEIVGSGILSSGEACVHEQEFIAATVAAKYATAARLRTEDELIRRTVLREGSRYVEVVCVGPGLDVRYRDRSVLEQVVRADDGDAADGRQRPAAEIAGLEQRDTSGL